MIFKLAWGKVGCAAARAAEDYTGVYSHNKHLGFRRPICTFPCLKKHFIHRYYFEWIHKHPSKSTNSEKC